MAGFCTRCGRPLPESGICPCTQQAQQPQYQQPQHQQPQQPQAPKEPSAFGLAIKGLPQLWLSYCKDPIGTTRKAVEKHDFLSGILRAAVTYIAVFFATLVYALRLDSHFPAVAWLGASLLMPVAGFGLTLLATLVLTKVTKVPSDFKGMLASSGLGMTFPATLAAGSIVLLLVYPGLISLLGVASFAVWAVVTVGTLLQVYGVKLNLVTILLCVAFCIAGYYAVSGLRDWFLHACYSYDINDVLSGLGDLFGCPKRSVRPCRASDQSFPKKCAASAAHFLFDLTYRLRQICYRAIAI